METNAVPVFDSSDKPTGCCPRFNPKGWDGELLHFDRKKFVKAKTRSLMHFPLNMGSVFSRTFAAIEKADAGDQKQFIVLSRDASPWKGEHYFSVTKDVPGEEMTELSGDFRTKIFEGPYKDAPKWMQSLEEDLKAVGEKAEEMFMFYTTCPKCAKAYGKNYVVAVAKTKPLPRAM